MWIDELDKPKRSVLNMIAGNLGLPELKEYKDEVHFLHDVYSRVNEAGGLARQIANLLNSQPRKHVREVERLCAECLQEGDIVTIHEPGSFLDPGQYYVYVGDGVCSRCRTVCSHTYTKSFEEIQRYAQQTYR